MKSAKFFPLPPADIHFGHSGISVRKQDARHAKIVFEKVQAQKERLQEFLSWPVQINSLKDQTNFSQKADMLWAAGQAYHFQIFKDEEFAGAISIHSLNYLARSFEFGYWVDSESEGKGLVKESLQILMMAMADRGWKQVKIRTTHRNIRSQKVAEKIGMTPDSQTEHFKTYSKALNPRS
ncbi:GNAT family N-acetyltransferase [Bdellovibrio bacteriovorus]|uniref:GNAT family N-acetyltransferase n=1 Tax=Bdellovibrio bacteriovorus TaxID=959 RepID=UPI000307B984|nr:GNAT family N-acetyltransferase [Bdellovibrio bacteriovorus]